MNLRRARSGERHLRVGIHPHDRKLLLADHLEEVLEICDRFAGYGSR